MHNMHNTDTTGTSWWPTQAAPVWVCGCGNVLLGDDGFGPAVVEALLAGPPLPPGVWVEDVGTGIRDLLFDVLLSPQRPRRLILVDATRQPGVAPGELLELALGDLTPDKVNDFSVHHFPSLNLLQELAAVGVEVRLLAVQAAVIPEAICPGLSPAVAAAVAPACAWIRALVGEGV